MYLSLSRTFLGVVYVHLCLALNIIINNDDGFASAQTREVRSTCAIQMDGHHYSQQSLIQLYRALNAAGHNAWIVAPVYDQSGQGGRIVFATKANLTRAGEYNSVSSKAPSYGTDTHDSHVWYYDGTPAACTFFALDYVVPNHWNGTTPDLFVTGPNFGNNIGPLLYTLSGTVAAAYSAVGRGFPAIAFSAGSYGPSRGYQSVAGSTTVGLPDPATIIGNLSTQLVNELAAHAEGGRLLPYGYGLTVNYPVITSMTGSSCLNPPFIRTRITGGAPVTRAVFDPSTGLFSGQNIAPNDGLNTCGNGDCSLPGEATVLSSCQSSVSAFTVDYDAPNSNVTRSVFQALQRLVTSESEAKNYTASSSGNIPSVAGSAVAASPSSGDAAISRGHSPNYLQLILAAIVLALHIPT